MRLSYTFKFRPEGLLSWFAWMVYRKSLQVTWGNRHWYNYEERLLHDSPLPRDHDSTIDYNKFESTEIYLEGRGEHRRQLGQQIIDQLLFGTSLAEDEEKICIITAGGTASGKSSAIDAMLSMITQHESSVPARIDQDLVKSLIPEYDEMVRLNIRNAATAVHSESIKLSGRAFKEAMKRQVSIISERTLHSEEKVKEDIKKLKKKGYRVFCVATDIPVEIALERAAKRFEKSGRWVPEERIREIHAGIPKCLFQIRHHFDELALFDNSGDALELMVHIEAKKGHVVNLSSYTKYLNRVGAQFDLLQDPI